VTAPGTIALRAGTEEAGLARSAARRGLVAILAVALALLALGCGATQLVAPAIDARAPIAVIEVDEFREPAEPPREGGIVYNIKTEEGRREAARAHGGDAKAPMTLAIAHNIALRINDHREELAARGLATPLVLVVTSQFPQGIMATGSRSGAGFAWPPDGLPRERLRVTGGEIVLDAPRERFATILGAPPYSLTSYGSGPFLVAAAFTIEPADGSPPRREFVGALDPDRAAEHGLRGLADEPRGQVIARIADFFAYHELRLVEPGAPLAFVRAAKGLVAEIEIGFERRTVHAVPPALWDERARRAPEDEKPWDATGYVGGYARVVRRGQKIPTASLWPILQVEEPP
jgi:hypothetical protein